MMPRLSCASSTTRITPGELVGCLVTERISRVSGHLGDELPACGAVEPVHREHLTVVGGDHRTVGADETRRPLHGALGEALAIGRVEDEVGECLAEVPLLALPPEPEQPARRLEADVEERQHGKRRERDRDLGVVTPQDDIGADREQQGNRSRRRRRG